MLTNEKIKELLQETISIAAKALELGNYPIGSIITDSEGNILAKDMNQRETQRDITAHAEILCIRQLGNKLDNYSEGEHYLFSSLEPCFGCSFFIARTNITKIYSALKDPHKGGVSDLASQEQFKKFFEGKELMSDLFPDLKEKSKKLMSQYFRSIDRPQNAAFYEK